MWGGLNEIDGGAQAHGRGLVSLGYFMFPERREHIGQERVWYFCISPASRLALNWREVLVDFIIVV